MAKKKRISQHEISVRYSSHSFRPEDFLTFVESTVFEKAWKRCSLTDDDLLKLQVLIMLNPKAPPVIKGSLRKIRFSPEATSHGKSGSHRALYVYFEDHGLVLLVTVYPKSKTDNISDAVKKAARQMIQEQKKILDIGNMK